MEEVKVLRILQLIHGGRALTAASSLRFSLGSQVHPPSSKSVPQGPQSCPGPCNADPIPSILNPLDRPAILIGTLTLPTLTLKCPNRSCLQFSDDSSTICCDILDFDACVIGKTIRVVAWNFIPSNHHGGFLEIIKWKLLNSGVGLGRSSRIYSLPLISGSSCASEYNSKHSYFVHGTLESISPVSVVPCSFGKSNKVGDSSASVNIQGFLVRIITCKCNLCSSRELKTVLHDATFRHSFTKPLFIYFCGSASCWHPVITKLVGVVVTLSRLKKKLIVMGKDESQLMLITTEDSILHLPSLFKKWLPHSETVVKGKGESGSFTGIIKGVYMEGMVIELDKEAWLLLSDQLLTPPHSLRVGAVISLRNVHFVKPKFSWTKVLILGACFRTSIRVESFSPLETEYYIVSQSQDLLGKFIGSLAFPARFWALLVILCFRKKFAGILSEKEIFGSRHKEGLAKIYIKSHLSSSMFQDRHGVFIEFCRHESCGCNREMSCSNLKLVVPISTFIHHGEGTWIKMLLRSEKNNVFCANNCSTLFSSEGKLYSPSKRRILLSEDLGIALLGHLKIATSGRMQLLDGTGSIDVIISDLRAAWEDNSIYELLDYRLMIEGIPELVDHLKLLEKSITFRSVFHCLPVAIERALSMFIHLSLRGPKCRNFSFYSSLDWKNNFCEFESGAFHLFLVTHKFPALLNSGLMTSNISTTFVEAIILPWDLALGGKDGALHLAKFSTEQTNERMEHYAIENNEHAPIKRQRTLNLTNKELTSGFLHDNLGSEFKTSCSHWDDSQKYGCGNLSNSREIQCMATVRCVNNNDLATSGILYHAKLSAKDDIDGKPYSEKVLLQFQSESSAKYHWLQIGGYYIMKHHIEDSFCKVNKFYEINNVRVLSSTERIWSLCLSFDDVFTNNKSIRDAVTGDSSFNRNDILLAEQDESLLQGAPGHYYPGTFSDVSLHLPSDAMGGLHVKLKELEENLIKPATKPEEAYNVLSSRTHLHGMLSGSYSNCLFPEGNLISLNGDVIAVHGLDLCTPSVQSNCEDPSLQLRFLPGHTGSCIHVMVDHQTVKIFGFLSRHTYLTGFGPGTNATFHRVLEVGGQNRLMLTPVSFIVINSIRVVDDLYSERCSSFPASDVPGSTSAENFSFALISELIPKCMDYKPIQFLCRVIAVNVLVLEKIGKHDNSTIQSRPGPIDIPLAGFLLDDGSSTCMCWADAERAATLLRLHEELPQTVLENCGWTLEWVGTEKNARVSIMYHLRRILEKHKRITVKPHGSMIDSSFPGLTVSACSDNMLSSSDENLLKFIVLHACFCISWTVVASMMDPDAVRHLEREHLVEVKTVHSLKNVWAREVSHTNSLSVARNIIQELLNR